MLLGWIKSRFGLAFRARKLLTPNDFPDLNTLQQRQYRFYYPPQRLCTTNKVVIYSSTDDGEIRARINAKLYLEALPPV